MPPSTPSTSAESHLTKSVPSSLRSGNCRNRERRSSGIGKASPKRADRAAQGARVPAQCARPPCALNTMQSWQTVTPRPRHRARPPVQPLTHGARSRLELGICRCPTSTDHEFGSRLDRRARALRLQGPVGRVPVQRVHVAVAAAPSIDAQRLARCPKTLARGPTGVAVGPWSNLRGEG